MSIALILQSKEGVKDEKSWVRSEEHPVNCNHRPMLQTRETDCHPKGLGALRPSEGLSVSIREQNNAQQ